MKIQIIGFSGSGKSTFAKAIGAIYHLPVLHIDTINFGPNWVERDDEAIDHDLTFFVSGENWVIDGNYFKHVPERFQKCNKLFIFEFNRFRCFYNVIKRYFRYRGRVRDSIASGCREKLDWEFIRWVLYDGRKRKPKFQELLHRYPEKAIVFRNHREVKHYLKQFTEDVRH